MKFREQRRPVDRDITVRTPDGRMSAKLRDISSSGMKILAPPVPLDTTVFVPIMGRDLEARVVFTDGTTLGLRFVHPLSKEQVTAMVSASGRGGFGQVQRFREM